MVWAHTHVGDRVELVIPASLGYGSQAAGDIPANSTLVFVVDIVGVATQSIAEDSVLSSAVATGEELPAGITVTGEPGTEPTLTIDESVSAPTEQKMYTIYKGAGEALTADQTSCTNGLLAVSVPRARLSRRGARTLSRHRSRRLISPE